MNRLITTTAVAMLLGLSPALAQTAESADETQQAPSMKASEQPSGSPSDPAMKATDQSSMKAPDQSSEGAKPSGPAMKATDQSSMKAPDQSPEGAKPAAEPRQTAQFLTKQEQDDWLASNIIGKSAVNAQNEAIATSTIS